MTSPSRGLADLFTRLPCFATHIWAACWVFRQKACGAELAQNSPLHVLFAPLDRWCRAVGLSVRRNLNRIRHGSLWPEVQRVARRSRGIDERKRRPGDDHGHDATGMRVDGNGRGVVDYRIGSSGGTGKRTGSVSGWSQPEWDVTQRRDQRQRPARDDSTGRIGLSVRHQRQHQPVPRVRRRGRRDHRYPRRLHVGCVQHGELDHALAGRRYRQRDGQLHGRK